MALKSMCFKIFKLILKLFLHHLLKLQLELLKTGLIQYCQVPQLNAAYFLPVSFNLYVSVDKSNQKLKGKKLNTSRLLTSSLQIWANF